MCSRRHCSNPPRPTHRYCAECHAAYMRRWRKTHPLTGDALRKWRARHHAHVTKARGKLIPQPCETCGEGSVEMHHDDYARPLNVRWLCRPCHLALHRGDVLKQEIAA